MSEAERATKYHVQRSTMKGGPYETIATTTSTEYTDEEVEKDLNYFYVIRAVNDEGDSRLTRSEEHTSELQSRGHLVCRLLLEKKNETRFKGTEAYTTTTMM